MLIWMIEMGERQVPLERVTIPAMRCVIDPFRDDLARSLAKVADDGDLSIVFVVGEDQTLSVTLKGDPFIVNRARDILGNRHRIGPSIS